jgi:hypothetical protein
MPARPRGLYPCFDRRPMWLPTSDRLRVMRMSGGPCPAASWDGADRLAVLPRLGVPVGGVPAHDPRASVSADGRRARTGVGRVCARTRPAGPPDRRAAVRRPAHHGPLAARRARWRASPPSSPPGCSPSFSAPQRSVRHRCTGDCSTVSTPRCTAGSSTGTAPAPSSPSARWCWSHPGAELSYRPTPGADLGVVSG